MLKSFTPIVLLIACGSIGITFAMTHILQPKALWILFIGGTFLNIVGVILLYFKFQKLNKITSKRSKI